MSGDAPGVLRLGGREFPPESFGIMAVLNRTPDSFFDRGVGGRRGGRAGGGRPAQRHLSNKDFIGETLGQPVQGRGLGSIAALAVSAWLGARVLRVHDVPGSRRALAVVAELRAAARAAGPLPPPDAAVAPADPAQ
jgi:dihydropteroate synthase